MSLERTARHSTSGLHKGTRIRIVGNSRPVGEMITRKHRVGTISQEPGEQDAAVWYRCDFNGGEHRAAIQDVRRILRPRQPMRNGKVITDTEKPQ